jgi:hypothetical protein
MWGQPPSAVRRPKTGTAGAADRKPSPERNTSKTCPPRPERSQPLAGARGREFQFHSQKKDGHNRLSFLVQRSEFRQSPLILPLHMAILMVSCAHTTRPLDTAFLPPLFLNLLLAVLASSRRAPRAGRVLHCASLHFASLHCATCIAQHALRNKDGRVAEVSHVLRNQRPGASPGRI